MTPFVIVCPTRSGSNWLSNLLNSHSALKVHGELFSLDRFNEEKILSIIKDPIDYLMSTFPAAEVDKAVGFKMLYDHLTMDYFRKEVALAEGTDLIQESNEMLNQALFDNFDEAFLLGSLICSWTVRF